MPSAAQPDIRVHPDPGALADAAATEVVRVAREAIAERGRFLVTLSGGSTPRVLYEALARDHRESIEWGRVHLLWGDERCVPPDHPMSNYGMTHAALLARVPIPKGHVHRLPAERAPADQVAVEYEQELASLTGAAVGGTPPALDLVLLGMGADGHTASLFPGDAAFTERERWVMPATAPDLPRHGPGQA
jgi:6-phosphogluconolactonase